MALASKLDVPRAAANFRVFADLMKTAGLESFQTETPDGNERAELCGPQALGVVGNHHSVESAAAAADLEGRAGAGLREYGGGEALGGNSGHSYAAG